MNRTFGNTIYVLRAVLLVGIQVILFNKLTLFDIARPFPYLLAILYLPIRMPRWQGLLFAFILGFSIDIFNYTYGIHAAASLFVFFVRDFFLHSILGVTEEATGEEPHLHSIGPSTFMLYLAGLVFVHHLVIAILDVLSWADTLVIILRSLVNTFFTMILLIIIEIIFFYKRGGSR